MEIPTKKIIGIVCILFLGATSVLLAQTPLPLYTSIQGLSHSERNLLIGIRMEKIGQFTVSRSKYTIEITSIKKHDWGVEVLARAWDGKGQIGFDKDGSVDIERFQFINPFFLVDDPNGTIITEHYAKYVGFYTTKQREDVRESLLQAIERTLDLKKLKAGSEKIVAGKIGDTTTTCYPDAGTGLTTVDGNAEYTGSALSWSDIWNNAGNASNPTATLTGPLFNGTGTAFDDQIRGLINCNTAPVPDTEDISSATLSLKGTHKWSTVSSNVVVAAGTTATNNNLTNSDYGSNKGPTLWSDTAIATGSWSTAGYNDFPLNATGIAAINKTGITKYSVLTSNDQSNTAPAATAGLTGVYYNQADNGSNLPTLVIESSAAAGGTTTVTPQAIIIQEGE